jgi:hypothetical protein
VQTTQVPSSTSTVQITQVVSSTGTKIVTSYTTATVTSYTGTSTSTSTRVVYTTLTTLASAAASSPLAYLSFVSLFAVSVGQKVTAGKSRSTRSVTSLRGLLTVFSLHSLSPNFGDHCDTILSRLISLIGRRCSID